uniref:Endo/exonuclease/phosphatase domain-containing protein n=1 Tax=Angiostrongylus cantonensis TaxID=6313 RepID=A0A0K0DMH9_ANGCA
MTSFRKIELLSSCCSQFVAALLILPHQQTIMTMRTKLRLINIILLLFDLLAEDVQCLGGKSFSAQSESNLIDRNYAVLMLCELQPHQNVVVNVSLILNPFQEDQLIKFQRAGVPFEVIIGDFNVKIGPRRSFEEHQIGTHGLEWNEPDELLSEFIMATKAIHETLQLIRQRGIARAAGNPEQASELAKQCRQAIKEDLKERRAAVMVEAAKAG